MLQRVLSDQDNPKQQALFLLAENEEECKLLQKVREVIQAYMSSGTTKAGAPQNLRQNRGKKKTNNHGLRVVSEDAPT